MEDILEAAMPLNPKGGMHKMVKLICRHQWMFLSSLDKDTFKQIWRQVSRQDPTQPLEGGMDFITLEEAKVHLIERERSEYPMLFQVRGVPKCYREVELRELWDSFIPAGTDVAQIWSDEREEFNWLIKPRGYYVVHRNRSSATLLRIPEDGLVRCPKAFVGRVLGKTGQKARDLMKEHGEKFWIDEF